MMTKLLIRLQIILTITAEWEPPPKNRKWKLTGMPAGDTTLKWLLTRTATAPVSTANSIVSTKNNWKTGLLLTIQKMRNSNRNTATSPKKKSVFGNSTAT